MSFSFKKGPRSSDWNFGGSKWKLSRSKIDLFMQCPRCFYIDNKFGVARPKMPSFTLNIAVDALLKKEFDIHRAGKTAHPLMQSYKIDAVPFQHKNMELWRDNFKGIQHVHEETGMTISGAVDDIWVDPNGKLMIVDYKATAKDGKVESLEDTKWQNQYKRQLEVYQWLLRKSGFEVSEIGYFVYVNGRADKEAFDGKLEFDVTLIAHTGDDSWVDSTILKIYECLNDSRIPACTVGCDHCNYLTLYRGVLQSNAKDTTESPLKLRGDGHESSSARGVQKKKKEEPLNINPLF